MPRIPRPLSKAEILGAFVALGMSAQYVDAKLSAPRSLQEAVKTLEVLKGEAKQAWRKLAFDLHPDRGGDENEFKKVKESYDLIVELHAGPPPRPKPRPVWGPTVVIHMNFSGGVATGGYSSSSTSTYTSTGGWY